MGELTIEATARLAASTLIVHDESVDFGVLGFLYREKRVCQRLKWVED
jgi:siroheme synthase